MYKCASCSNSKVVVGRDKNNEPIVIFCECGVTTVIDRKKYEESFPSVNQEIQEEQGIVESYI